MTCFLAQIPVHAEPHSQNVNAKKTSRFVDLETPYIIFFLQQICHLIPFSFRKPFFCTLFLSPLGPPTPLPLESGLKGLPSKIT